MQHHCNARARARDAGDATLATRARARARAPPQASPRLSDNVQRAMWMPDGKSMLVSANDGTTTGLWIQPIDGKARRIELGKVVATAPFWLDASIGPAGELAFTGSEPEHPAELYYLASATSAPQRITDFNREVALVELGRTETVEWDCDKFHMDGVVTYPPDFATSKKYPLVLYVHGGPRSASKEAFSSRAQLLAAQGWVVFEPNYRGSDNLGNEFEAAIWNDAGAGSGPRHDGRSGARRKPRLRRFLAYGRFRLVLWLAI